MMLPAPCGAVGIMAACLTHMPTDHKSTAAAVDVGIDVRHREALLNTGALQGAIVNSANFSSIATDAKGVIQILNVGAERMLG